ncbi:MAG: methionine adenosyltransferase [Verrucomicrobiae bacterium]|nr:methionine adenosyltransferase [Verrucomicrobiae bacterium]NNJ86908.1 methionine adenosyltransferase [Akkermansiaceae bacterium]
MSKPFIFSSESVTEGHPDKVCDTISDAVLDACLEQDISSRVACETFVKDNVVGLAGEITTDATFDYGTLVKNTIKEIGYDQDYAEDTKFSYTCKFEKGAFLMNMLGQQSPDIKQGVDAQEAADKGHDEQGAGDQGIMFGYAANDTKALMPAAIHYSHRLGEELTKLRKDRIHTWLRPDSKTQVSIEYIDNKPNRFTSVVISTMHAKEITTQEIRDILKRDLIEKHLPGDLLTPETEILINPTGLFVIGGPEGDAGLTGRKIIVDTYGGMGRHGGGAFSGKDPSKVDRSAAYMCRWVAKNIVAAGFARECELQLAYAIGHPHPVSVNVNTFGSNEIDELQIESAVKEVFSFKPADIISQLDLLRPIYGNTTNYGHFGREDAGLPWEETNKVEALKAAL